MSNVISKISNLNNRIPNEHEGPFTLQMWSDLERLFLCKKECMERGLEMGGGTIHRELGTETLVL
jgi:hypothetical protein